MKSATSVKATNKTVWMVAESSELEFMAQTLGALRSRAVKRVVTFKHPRRYVRHTERIGAEISEQPFLW